MSYIKQCYLSFEINASFSKGKIQISGKTSVNFYVCVSRIVCLFQLKTDYSYNQQLHDLHINFLCLKFMDDTQL